VTNYEGIARGRGHTRRVASSVWLPWTISALLLVSLAAAAVVVGRPPELGGRVPAAALNGQESMTATSAQEIRRNLNHGFGDLTALARTLSKRPVANRGDLRPLLAKLRGPQGRYRSLYVTNLRGSVVAKVGSGRHPSALPTRVTGPGMTHAVDARGGQVIASYAPLAGPDGARWVLAGEYDLTRLRRALAHSAPASAWVVDDDGRALHTPTGPPSYTEHDGAFLRRASVLAGEDAGYKVEAEPSDAPPEVVAWAPVVGPGPAGSLGLGVVSSRPLDQLTEPAATPSP
jgi:hypothetical protein